MSLVNEMLKDLEKHHQKDKNDYPQQGNGDGPPPPPPEPNRKRSILYGAGIAALVVVVLLVIMLFETEHHSTSAAQQNSSPPQTSSSTTPATTTITEQDSEQSTPDDSEAQSTANDETQQAVPAQNESNQSTAETQHDEANDQTKKDNSNTSEAEAEAEAQSAIETQPAQSDSAKKDSSSTAADSRIKIAEPTLTKEQRLAKQYNQAMENIHSGHDDRAISTLSTILKQNPNYKNARVTLAAVLIRHQQIARAETVLQAGLKQLPKDPDYAKLTAHILVQQGRTVQALQLLNYAKPKTIDANNVNYFALMASLYMQQQDYRNAKNIYQRLVTKDPLNATWWAGLGIAADKLGLTVEAHNAFARANKIGDLSPALQNYIDKESSYL